MNKKTAHIFCRQLILNIVKKWIGGKGKRRMKLLSYTFIQHLESYNAPNTVSRFLRNDKADV